MGQARLVTPLLLSLFFTGLVAEARTMEPPAEDLHQGPQGQTSPEMKSSELLGSDKHSNVTDKRPSFRGFMERDVTLNNKLQGETTSVNKLSTEVSDQTSGEVINKINESTIDNSFPNQEKDQYNKSLGHKMGSDVSTTNDTGNEAVETLAFGQERSAMLDGMPRSLEKRSYKLKLQDYYKRLNERLSEIARMKIWKKKNISSIMDQKGVKRVSSRLDRMPFYYGKRSLGDSSQEWAATGKRARLDRMAFGYGKRVASFEGLQQLNEKRDRLERMAFGYGKRNSPDDDWQSSEALDAEKRAKRDRMAFSYGKRTFNEDDNVSLEKKDRLDRMAFGYGKRTLNENHNNVSVEKRDRLDRMAFGYGKRNLAGSRSVDELTEETNRSRLDRRSFAFGKMASPERSHSVAADVSKRARLDRMAFGYGKRGLGLLLRPQSVDVVADDRAKSRRARLDMMAFGYGKRGFELTLELDHSMGESEEEEEEKEKVVGFTNIKPCTGNVDLCGGNRESMQPQPQLVSYDTQHEQQDQQEEKADDEQEDLTKRARLDRMTFAYGKRFVSFPDTQHHTTPQGADNEHDGDNNDSDEKEENENESSIVVTAFKRDRLDRMAFGYGKRSAPIQPLHNMFHKGNLSPGLQDIYSAVKRARLDRMPNGFGKRAAMLDRMPSGFGKRAAMLDRMPQGFGRRGAMWNRMPRSTRKRAAMLDRRPRYVGKRMSILARMPGGFGKRSASSHSPVFS